MADKEKTSDKKPELEREYIIPLRNEWRKVANYRRTGRAIKFIKQFIARHMKVPDRDISKVKLDLYLNQEIWFKGKKKPPAKIKVRARKEGDIVRVELAELPEHWKFEKAKHERMHKEAPKSEKPAVEKPEEKKELEEKKKEDKKEETPEEKEEKKKEEKEKSAAVAEQKAKQAGIQAKAMQKATSKSKQTPIHRKALKK